MADEHERPSLEEERALIEGCRRGEAVCWHRLIELHRKEVWAVLYRVLGPTDELEDLVQTVFVRVIRTLDRFEGRSRLSTWIYRICVRAAVDHLRQRRRRREVPMDPNPEPRADPALGPEEALLRQQDRERLGRALKHIKETKRSVLIMHDLLEVPAEEIGRALGLPPATVRTRLFHARRELAARLAREAEREP